MKPDKLILYGKDIKGAVETDPGSLRLKEAYEFSITRDAGDKFEVPLNEDNQYEFTLSDNTTWFCDMHTMHELFPGVRNELKRSEGSGFELPSRLQGGVSERGIVGDIALKLLKVFAKKAIPKGIGVLAKRLEDQCLFNGLADYPELKTEAARKKYLESGAAIFRLDENFNFIKFEAKKSDKPFLLFIHGTNSDTKGAFIQLKNAAVWNKISDTYGDNIIAFQHRTLTESPLENAVKLASMLPDKAMLHIISHSRGGLIGDILSKYSSADKIKPAGFSNTNITLLENEGRNNDADFIRELNTIFKTKKITVSKFVRVACPAAGTILASKRLDIVLNVFGNLLGGDANPFIDVFKELLSEAVRTKDNAKVLPGIEAQTPSSPFIKILNDQSRENLVEADSLAVIAGDSKFSFSWKGLATILTNLFYWQRNDWVVNTDSMYLGAARKGSIQYFFDEGAKVNHMDYFLNDSTRIAIGYALETDSGKMIPGFSSAQQTEIPAADRALEHGELFPNTAPPSGKKPIVVIVPGIMGSNLYDGDKRLWLNYWGMLKGNLSRLDIDGNDKIESKSIVKTSYYKLAKRLDVAYDVVVFPFDWRKQLNECAAVFNTKIIELLGYKQPIKIIGHSMGGVLVRDFIINHSNTWQILNGSKGFRLLFLGAPLGGSHRILTVLYGQDSIINSLNIIDPFHSKKELVNVFRKFPGILSLLPLSTDKDNDFAQQSVWDSMRQVAGENDWPIPEQGDLKIFGEYRKNILAKKDKIDYSNMVYIAGKDKTTPSGYFKDEIPPRRELLFLYTEEGDQSVTWESGIPSQIEAKGNVYYAPVSHGALACDSSLFDGIEEILEKGNTDRLSKRKPDTDEKSRAVGEKKQQGVFQVEDYNFDFSERGISDTILGISRKGERISTKIPLKLNVGNGDLSYSSYPVLAGHFLNDEILYAEKVVDSCLNGKLSATHLLGVYPGEIGTHEIVISNNVIDDIPGAIIVGLGEQGNFTAYQLTRTVELGVAKYLLQISETKDNNKELGISALIIGSGFGGLTIESSVKAIIEGVNNANAKIEALNSGSKPGKGNELKLIRNIEFIELYKDRAVNCLYALRKIESAEDNTYNAYLSNKKIKNLLGAKRRLPVDSAEEWWNRISVKLKKTKEADTEINSLVFGASTGMAREDEQELFAGTHLIDLFIEEISTQNNWSDSTARTLFELMIPNDFKDRLKRKGNIAWVLDEGSAAYPWELLQDNSKNAKPLCINAGMVRQLSIRDYRTAATIRRVTVQKTLIVADPLLNGFVNQLPGAKEEGERVNDLMIKNGYTTNALISNTAGEIVKSIFSDEYKIMHLAGHGVYNPEVPQKSGMVIGKNEFLSVFDIEQMPVVPELVFVNCCYLGKVNASYEKYFKDRFRLASNIGTQLIRIGVKAVVVAGWAVDDSAAVDFAQCFYRMMFDGYSFGDAVKSAREKIYKDYKGVNNTWGAYQCYGDPFYRLSMSYSYKSTGVDGYITPEQAETDLENLFSQLDLGLHDKKTAEEKLRKIIKEVDEKKMRNADITEKEALINIEIDNLEEAEKKFKELLKIERAAFLFSSVEKYYNVKAKLCLRRLNDKKLSASKALAELKKVIDSIRIIVGAGETAERYNILGSSYKRMAMIVNSKDQMLDALEKAAEFYEKGYYMENSSDRNYSATNAIKIKCLLKLLGKDVWEKPSAKKIGGLYTIEASKVALKKIEDDAQKEDDGLQTFWKMSGTVSMQLCRLFLNGEGNKTESWENIKKGYISLWDKAGSEGKKTTQVEHLQFLTHVLSFKSGNKRVGSIPAKKTKSVVDGIEVEIERLKNAYQTIINKGKAKGRSTQRKGTVKK